MQLSEKDSNQCDERLQDLCFHTENQEHVLVQHLGSQGRKVTSVVMVLISDLQE